MSRAKPLFTSAAAAVLLAATGLVRADEGMWLFNKPPVDDLAKYDFEPSAEWLEHIQKSCVRVSTGGSGSIVSADGLVMTNHHVGSDILEKLSSAERDLLETGFLARTRAEELRCPDLEVMVLWTIEDVTARIEGAVADGADAAAANAARRGAMAALEKEAEAATGLKSEVVTLYQGGRYHLYGYRRYTDVRLVMAPEKAIAAFGGDTDNFEYPRYCLDMCFFRIYEDGAPLAAEHWLRWSDSGASAGDLVFVAGHPGRTERLFTVDHLAFLRDVRHPHVLERLWRNEVRLTTFADRSAEQRRIAQGDLLSTQNARKAYTGLYAGLLDPSLMAQKRKAEAELRKRVQADPQAAAAWGSAWDDIAAAYAAYSGFYGRSVALGGSRMNLGGELFAIAKDLVRLADEREKPNEERLREYGDAQLDKLERGILSPAPIYPALEVQRMEGALQYMAEELGGADPTVLKALDGKAPRARAEELVGGTLLADVAARRLLLDGGRAAIEASDDPMIKLVLALDDEVRALRQRHEDEVEGVERGAYARIAEARFAIEGENSYPDATFTLRLSYGTVTGYREGDTEVPPFTTLRGVYEREAERGGTAPFDLPPSWTEARERLDLDTPFNFVATPDIIGGNSGSPVVDRAGEVVGLIFDGNLHSLIGDIAYTDEQARAVSVDSRGIVESLRAVYRAEALVRELTGAGAER
jgi:hypothetical protein